jgi:hypothetical protein
MTEKPRLGPGEQLVTRVDSRGNLVYSVQKITGRVFVEDDETKGYVTDAPLMMLTLGKMDIPGTWFRTWATLVGFQQLGKSKRRRPLGMIKTSHRDISTESGISRAYVGEAMPYFHEIGWVRTAKVGIYQLNPYLTFAGTSADQERAQEVWNAAVAEFVMPGPNHAAEWRKHRRDDQRKIAQAANVVALEGARKNKANTAAEQPARPARRRRAEGA